MAKRGNIGQTLVWILLGLLILSLGGFGVTNFAANVRNVGAVGDTPISLTRYATALQNEIRATEAQFNQAIPFDQALAMRLDQRALNGLITATALDNESAGMGLSIGDNNLATQIRDMPAFQGPTGGFDQDAYDFALDRAGLNKRDFEETLRTEAARTLLQGAIASGNKMPSAFGKILSDYASQTRDFSYITLTADSMSEALPDPDDKALRAYFDANPDDFTTPGVKKITYAWLSPDHIMDTVEVDEIALRELYDERINDFVRPERRLVERLIFTDTESAAAAKAALNAGQKTFEQLVTDRGLSLGDIDMGDVSATDLGSAGDIVFAAQSGDVTTPVDTDLGPALFRVNAILDAEETSFEDAKAELRDELAADRARRVIDGLILDIDTRIASGATLEELADETDMTLAEIDWFENAEGDITGYAAFRDAAETVTTEDFPKVIQLEDGGIFALRLNAVQDPRLQDFDTVRDEVIAGWETSETRKALETEAAAMLALVQNGTDIATLDQPVQTQTGITRTGFVAGAPRSLIAKAFELDISGADVLTEGDSTVYLLQLDTIGQPDSEDADAAALKIAIESQLNAGLTRDLFNVFANDIQTRAGITIDRRAIEAVHNNFR